MWLAHSNLIYQILQLKNPSVNVSCRIHIPARYIIYSTVGFELQRSNPSYRNKANNLQSPTSNNQQPLPHTRPCKPPTSSQVLRSNSTILPAVEGVMLQRSCLIQHPYSISLEDFPLHVHQNQTLIKNYDQASSYHN